MEYTKKEKLLIKIALMELDKKPQTMDDGSKFTLKELIKKIGN